MKVAFESRKKDRVLVGAVRDVASLMKMLLLLCGCIMLVVVILFVNLSIDYAMKMLQCIITFI